MKKALKLTTYILVLCGIVSLGLCYLIIPERTKYAMDIVIEYLNKPLGIAFGTTITLGLVIVIVLKCFSTFVVNKNKEELEDYKKRVEVLVESAKDYESIAKQHYDELQKGLDVVIKYVQLQQEHLEQIGETIPNKKVRELVKSFKGEESNGKREETTND